jgi:hypothetical protein
MAYHKSYIFILADQTFGLVNFVHEDLKEVVREVARLHERALGGEKITDEMWATAGANADALVALRISGGMEKPVATIMQASTRKGSLSMLKQATDMLILVITSFASQNGASAVATVVTARLPGGKLTQEALRGVIYKKLLEFSS